MKLEIIVVACRKRKALVIPYLVGKSYKIHYTKDYDLPKDFKPASNMVGVVRNHLGAYRCYKGHQDALLMADSDYILILEDDAVPNTNSWFQTVLDAIPLLDSFEIISFHGRQYNQELFEKVKDWSGYIKPNDFPVWMVAALAYMVKRENVKKYLKYKYYGKPWDILLYQHHSFCVLEKSIFDHDRSEGSLID